MNIYKTINQIDQMFYVKLNYRYRCKLNIKNKTHKKKINKTTELYQKKGKKKRRNRFFRAIMCQGSKRCKKTVCVNFEK